MSKFNPNENSFIMHIITDYCHVEKEKNAILLVFSNVLRDYKYFYQHAYNKRARDAKDKQINHLVAVIPILRSMGHVSIANDIESILEREKEWGATHTTENTVKKQVRAVMKEELSSVLGLSKFNKISKILLEAFVDECDSKEREELPPEGVDINWEPAF